MATLRIPDDDDTRVALVDWFDQELTWQRFVKASDNELVGLLLHRLRELSVPDPEA